MSKLFQDVDALKQFVELRREALVYSLAKHMYAQLRDSALSPEPADADRDWQPVESLSQLRGVVGGRFVTVKSHWVAAGFPLRAHRGDRSAAAMSDADGWTALCIWLDELGFEARLGGQAEAVCFEIRQKAKTS